MKGLREDKTGLGQGSLAGVDKEDRSVNHRKCPFNLAAEIGMPGRIKNIDLYAVPYDRTVLSGNCDSPFPFKVHIVHQALCSLSSLPEHSALFKHRIHKGSLSVVDMGYYRNIANRIILCILYHGI
jgi:hypothetical protein